MKSTINLSLSGLALAVSVLLSPVMADEVSDSIKEATTAYESGDINATVENLNYAVQLLQQMKGQQLSELLPDALDGWTAEDSESTAVGAAMFGGGLTAERKYRKDKKSRVSIQIVTDSPLLQSSRVGSSPINYYN